MTNDTTIGLAGDWHGNTVWARYALATFGLKGIKTVHHVGDFGLFWPGNAWNKYFNEVNGACIRWKINLYITPGNHENWDAINALKPGKDGLVWIKKHIAIIPRGHRFELGGRSFVSLSGAPSIDFQMRVQGHTWWREEMITLREAEKVAAGGYADVMLAHDAPDKGTYEVQRIIDTPASKSGWSSAGLAYAKQGRDLMDIAFRGVRPKMFIHGHFHVRGERDDGRTQFISLNCDGYSGNMISLDLDTLEYEWLELVNEIPR